MFWLICRYWVQGKFNTVKRFSKSSLRVGREYEHFPIWMLWSPDKVGSPKREVNQKIKVWTSQTTLVTVVVRRLPLLFNLVGHRAHRTGFPIWIKGVEAAPIGAIIVSGLAQLEDHQLIVCQSLHYLANNRSTQSLLCRSTSSRPVFQSSFSPRLRSSGGGNYRFD